MVIQTGMKIFDVTDSIRMRRLKWLTETDLSAWLQPGPLQTCASNTYTAIDTIVIPHMSLLGKYDPRRRYENLFLCKLKPYSISSLNKYRELLLGFNRIERSLRICVCSIAQYSGRVYQDESMVLYYISTRSKSMTANKPTTCDSLYLRHRYRSIRCSHWTCTMISSRKISIEKNIS